MLACRFVASFALFLHHRRAVASSVYAICHYFNLLFFALSCCTFIATS
jgi:hypothetical protein